MRKKIKKNTLSFKLFNSFIMFSLLIENIGKTKKKKKRQQICFNNINLVIIAILHGIG